MRLSELLNEKLKPSQYRKYVKEFVRDRYEDIFNKYKQDWQRTNYRIYIPFERNVNIPIPPAINNYLKSKFIKVETSDDYIKGYGKDNKGRPVRLGRVLNREPELKKQFDNDPHRSVKNQSKFYAIISRHPYDIAGMTTDRDWPTSCMNLEGGCNRHYVIRDVKLGTLVAYCVTEDDKSIQKPLSRLLIKPDADGYMYVAGRMYGQQLSEFRKVVNEWVKEEFPDSINASLSHPDLYYDDDEPVERYDDDYIEDDYEDFDIQYYDWEHLEVGQTVNIEGVPNNELQLTYIPLVNIPDRVEFNHEVDISNNRHIQTIGNDVSFNYGLNLSESAIYSIGNDVRVDGHLFLSDSAIEKIGNNARVAGKLDLDDCPNLEKIGDNLKVGGDLNIKGCINLKSLGKNNNIGGEIIGIDDGEIFKIGNNIYTLNTVPNNSKINANINVSDKSEYEVLKSGLIINGNLNASESSLQTIEDNVSIEGDLDLSYTNIKELGDNLVVNGSLNLRNTPITSLPNNLTIGKDLYLRSSSIQELPEYSRVVGSLNLRRKFAITGDLDLAKSGILKLPNGLIVKGLLDLEDTEITELPNGLKVGGQLNLAGVRIKELPNDLKVMGSIYLTNSMIEKIPDNFIVGGDLKLYNTPIKTLPDNLKVGGVLVLCKTQIEELPTGLKVGNLNLLNTKITKLPDDLEVINKIVIEDSSKLKYIPEHLKGKIEVI